MRDRVTRAALDQEARLAFADRLNRLMAERGMLGCTLALMMDVTESSVSCWRRGKNYPDGDHLRRLRAALGCRWGDLFPDFDGH